MKKLLSVAWVVVFAIMALPYTLHSAPPRLVEKSFPVKMGGKLELDLDTGGRLEISGWSKEEIAVTAEIGGKDQDDAEIEFEATSSSVEIHSSCNHHLRGCRCKVRFVVRVPERCDVHVESSGGAVIIDGVEGKLSGQTMGGEIELSKIKGYIDLETMGGRINVEDCEADGKVHTMGGAVVIRGVRGNLKGSTMGGKVTYENVSSQRGAKENEELNVSTMGGDIEIGSVDEKVKAETYGGDITVEKAEEVNVSTMGGDINVNEAPAGAKVKTMGGDITIRSAGNRVNATTMGGDIDLGAVDGSIKASTMGGDVVAKMVGDPAKGDRNVEIESMGGDIELTVPAGLSMKFDIEIEYTKKFADKAPKIESEFGMNIEETKDWESHHGSKRKHIYGTGEIGGGANLIKIKTINGNITIKKG